MNNITDMLTISSQYAEMLIRFALCTLCNWLLVDRLYYRKSHRRDFYFTFMLIAIAIFLLVYFMIFSLEDMKAKTSMGIGIGLFGIFSIMRYRTETMPVREMTYLFVIIALSVINAIANNNALIELVITNAIVLLITYICERQLQLTPSKLIQYDRIQLITPDKRQLLIDDLKQRTGLDIIKVEIGTIDMLKDMALIRVYYKNNGESTFNPNSSLDR